MTHRWVCQGWLARGFGARKPTEIMLTALDDAAGAGGLSPGMKGRVAEPWDRAATVDGTLWPEEDRVMTAPRKAINREG